MKKIFTFININS